MNADQEKNVMEVLDGASDLSVATVREDGYPQATIVSFVHDGTRIYFGCGKDSQKARNIRHNDKVSVTMEMPYEKWSEIRGVSLGGRAHIVEDDAEIERVYEMMLKRFPEIEGFLDDDEREQATIVRIDPEVISLLDYRQGFGHTEEFRVGNAG